MSTGTKPTESSAAVDLMGKLDRVKAQRDRAWRILATIEFALAGLPARDRVQYVGVASRGDEIREEVK